MRPPIEIPETVAVRVAGRIGMSFFLRHLQVACDGHDFLDGLLLMAVRQANLEHLDRDAALRGRHDVSDRPPHAALFRPIAINALAASLRTPFETVRRRVAQLRARGELEMSERGVVIAAARAASPRHAFDVYAVSRLVRAAYLDLRELGVLRAAGEGAPPAAREPDLLVARLAAEYCLRQFDSLSRNVGDPSLGLLLIHIVRGTTEHLDETYTEYTEIEDLVRDDLRRPIPVSVLASRSGVPPETARRHAAVLVERGWAARTATGLYLTRDMLRQPPFPEARRENVANFNRLFGGLASAGVLGLWNAERAA